MAIVIQQQNAHCT